MTDLGFDPTRLLILPKGWVKIAQREDGAMYRNQAVGLSVICSGAIELDGRHWVHVSLSRRSRMPSYDDLKLVKNLFIGESNQAVQVFPPAGGNINLHPYCLHLWHCVDGDGLPDFAHGGNSI